MGGLDDIGLGPVSQLSINDLVNFKEDIFHPLFGDSIERNGWINVTTAVNVATYLENKLDDVIGSITPELSMACELENTDDLQEGESPYRFAMELVVSGSLISADFNLASLSPEIAVLPEDSYDPLSLTIESFSADYLFKLPMTIDVKRRKFMIGEIVVKLSAGLNTNVQQSILLTESVSQNFQGSLDLDLHVEFSTKHDWSYTSSFEARLIAETSVGTAVTNLELIATDDDLFDDKPREYHVHAYTSYILSSDKQVLFIFNFSLLLLLL